MTEKILKIKNIGKIFQDNKLKVLTDISFDLNKGDVLCVVGPSGAGKTVLLRCLAGIESITKGEMTLLDRYKISHSNNQDLNLWRKKVTVVFQDFNLWPSKTVLENIILAPVLIQKKKKKEATKKAEFLLKKFNLFDKRNAYPDFLSGGQKQRAAIIRALATDPEVLLLDEITSALDPQLINSVLQIIKVLANEGQSMVVVTHHLKFAAEISDKMLFLDKGHLVQLNETQNFIYSQKNSRINDFIRTVSSGQQKINVYEGYDEFQSYHTGLIKRIKRGSDLYVVGAAGNRWYECMGDFYDDYEKTRIKNKISWKMVIYAESQMDKKVREKFPELTQYRIIPKKLETPANYIIVEDMLIVQTFDEPPAIVEIKSSNIAKAYLNYFNLLWENGTPVV